MGVNVLRAAIGAVLSPTAKKRPVCNRMKCMEIPLMSPEMDDVAVLVQLPREESACKQVGQAFIRFIT